MRKLFTAALALLVTASMTWAQVESANVVGYNTVTLKVGINAIAPSFDKVGGGAMSLQEVIPGDTPGLKKGNVEGAADNITIWDQTKAKYDIYFLHDGTGKNNTHKTDKWVSVETDAVAEDVFISASDGIFYANNSTADIDVSIAGQVVAPVASVKDIPYGNTMIASPYTFDWYLNNDGPDGAVIVDWATSEARKGNIEGAADNLMVWDLANSKYNNYFLHDGTGKNNGPKANKWVDVASDDVAVGLVLKANESFFYINNSATQSTISLDTASPYSF